MKTIKDIVQRAHVEMSDLTFQVKWALLWFGLITTACIAMWSIHGAPLTERGRAEKIASAAAKMSLSGPQEAARLAEIMAPEALQRAWADREASGLDEALARSGVKIKTSAWAVKSEKVGQIWISNGFAKSTIEREGQDGPQSWTGAWQAELAPVDGSMKVIKLKVASLPEGAKLDQSAFEAAEPAPFPQPGLRMEREMARSSKH